MKKIFDTYLFADWSAASRPTRKKPKKDAIWIGELEPGSAEPKTYYCRTRQEATALVRERLEYHVSQERRVLVGFDFPYGYSRGTGLSLGFDQQSPWLEMWKLLAESIEDTPRNVNNRWEVASSLNERISPGSAGPFWGCPPSRQNRTLSSRKT